MRILHVDSGREMRGGQWQVLRLVLALDAAGLENTLLAPAASPLFRKARQAGVDTRPLTALSLFRLSRRAGLVHAHDARSHTLAALVSAASFVVSRRVAFPARSRWKYGRAAHYLAVSEFVRRTLLEAGVPESSVSVVYDGIRVPDAPASGRNLLIPDSPDPNKGTALALEAAALAGVSATLSCDLEKDLASAALLVYITRSEGLGSAALLAMAAGVPVIASNVGGLPEIVQHQHTGLLTENSAPAIAAAIRWILDHPLEARIMGACARQHITRNFTEDLMMSRTLAVYRKCSPC